MDEDKKTNEQSVALRLLKNRSMILTGQINMDTADSIVQKLLVLDSEGEDPIYIYINSPGGDVDSGFAIYDMIKYVKSPVYVIGMGLVASAAALIYLSVPRERRIALPDSTYLIHQPLSKMRGTAIELDIYAKKIGKLRKKLDAVIAHSVGKSVEEVERDTERDYWLSAEEALSYGLVGRIVERREDI